MPLIDRDLWTSDEYAIFRRFGFKCIHCRINDAVTLHELVPKSLLLNWNIAENRVPLCHACHVWAHQKGTRYSRKILVLDRENFHVR